MILVGDSIGMTVLGYETTHQIVFYEDEAGEEPARKWIKADLTATQRRAIGVAMHEMLAPMGVAVCETEWGSHV